MRSRAVAGLFRDTSLGTAAIGTNVISYESRSLANDASEASLNNAGSKDGPSIRALQRTRGALASDLQRPLLPVSISALKTHGCIKNCAASQMWRDGQRSKSACFSCGISWWSKMCQVLTRLHICHAFRASFRLPGPSWAQIRTPKLRRASAHDLVEVRFVG